MQTPWALMEIRKSLSFGRLGAKLPGGHLYVLLLHRRDHIRRGQPACRHLVGIQPDAHRVFTRAENLDLADAGQAPSSSFTFSVA
jgi:hypothetical protein